MQYTIKVTVPCYEMGEFLDKNCVFALEMYFVSAVCLSQIKALTRSLLGQLGH